MADYHLSNAAEQDLEEIYAYSFSEFGEFRADAYFQSLETCLERLAEQPQLGMKVPGVRKNCSRFVHQRHIVYYTISNTSIFFVRILGPGMSADRNLP